MSTLLIWYPMEQHSFLWSHQGLSWPHQGHRLWASLPVAFWVHFYKVQRCPWLGAHDWKKCPYWHYGERARRRDPRTHHYLPEPCSDYLASYEYHKTHHTGRAPTCLRGRTCSYAHGIFELWMHPDRFRTFMCDAGLQCGREICFFAHFFWERRCSGDMVPFVDLQLLMSWWPLCAPPHPLPPHPRPTRQRGISNMMLQTRSGMRRIPLTDEATASSFSWSSFSAGSSSSTSSSALLSSSPPDVAIAAAATTSPMLGYPEGEAAASMLPEVGYPADDEMDNGMSDDEDSELGEFPYYDIIKDFVLG